MSTYVLCYGKTVISSSRKHFTYEMLFWGAVFWIVALVEVNISSWTTRLYPSTYINLQYTISFSYDYKLNYMHKNSSGISTQNTWTVKALHKQCLIVKVWANHIWCLIFFKKNQNCEKFLDGEIWNICNLLKSLKAKQIFDLKNSNTSWVYQFVNTKIWQRFRRHLHVCFWVDAWFGKLLINTCKPQKDLSLGHILRNILAAG